MKYKKKALIVALSASFLTVGNANAQQAVVDWAAIGQSIKEAAQSAAQHAELLMAQAAQQSALLSQIYQVAGMQSTANEQTQKQVAKSQNDIKNADREADNAKEQIKADAKAAEAVRPTLIACKQRASGAAGAGARGGGGGGAIPAKLNAQINDQRNSTVSLADASNQVLGNKSLLKDLCNGEPQEAGNRCNGAIGSKPDANVKSGSIFAAAGTGPTAPVRNGKVDASVADPVFVMDAENQQIARMSITNIISGAPPAALGKAAQATPAGRAYLGQVGRYNDRLSTGVDALTYIAGLRAEAENLTDSQKEGWADVSKWIPKLYLNRKAPGKPSVYEYMNTQVYYVDLPEYHKQIDAESDVAQLTKQLIYRTNLNTQVQWMNYTLMEKMVAIQAASLGQTVEPINREMLNTLKAEAESQTTK